jgi:hypothetical protein
MSDYTDFYLGFPDEATATAVLYTTVVEVQDKTGHVIVEASVTPNYANISTIGIIYQPQTDPDTPPVPYAGWYVNVRLVGEEDAAALTPFSVDPQPFPMRVWA